MAYLSHRLLNTPKNILFRCYNKIVITDDGSTIVALHKESEFPYEHSKSLPEEVKDESILKMNDFNEARRVFKNMTPEMSRKHLSTLTLTTEHRWFPRARDKKARNTEMNRPYL
ncbi:39S ribosomal protein L42, mitochondrial [Galleria mellonella]|uniref:Large ribosomal subunit protein mL42 n=1 Tax=Galleria mellonella TaxID=7137 RepID=A0A6J1WU25_GALME|nr:39S ribosomal protein L42, mitochondrial [Galleria mellonella]